MDGVELLEDIYGPMVLAPLTMTALLAITPLPKFQTDPTRGSGRVILEHAWVQENIVFEWLPTLGQRHIHRAMVLPLYEALARIANSPFYAYIKPKQCGIFVPRRTCWKDGNRLSTHALGLAIDINWNENLYGVKNTPLRQQKWIIKVFREAGFFWGGDWKTPDNMHFQFLGPKIKLPR